MRSKVPLVPRDARAAAALCCPPWSRHVQGCHGDAEGKKTKFPLFAPKIHPAVKHRGNLQAGLWFRHSRHSALRVVSMKHPKLDAEGMQDQTGPHLAILPLHAPGPWEPRMGHWGWDTGADSRFWGAQPAPGREQPKLQRWGSAGERGEARLQVVCFQMCLQLWSLHVELINC